MNCSIFADSLLMLLELFEDLIVEELQMDAFKVAIKVTFLAEPIVAHDARERFLACVLFEVIPNVAALLKDRATVGEQALKVEVKPTGLLVQAFHHPVKAVRDPLERLSHIRPLDYSV